MFQKGRRIREVIMNGEKCAKLRIFDADFVTGFASMSILGCSMDLRFR